MSVSTGSGAIFEGPAVLTVTDAETVELAAGRCSVHAPPGAEGFRIETPAGSVIDLGTRFSVEVDAAGEAEVHVVEGEAELRPRATTAGGGESRLRDGRAARISEGEAGLVELPFVAERYVAGLPDRVVRYDAGPGRGRLLSVTVQRNGRERAYAADDLIGLTVERFERGSRHHVAVAAGGEDARRGTLEDDDLLHTGLINATYSPQPGGSAGQGLAVRFDRGVVNGPGPDVVLFEIRSKVYPATGDPFHVIPLDGGMALTPCTVGAFDLTLLAAEALPVPEFTLLSFGGAWCRSKRPRGRPR